MYTDENGGNHSAHAGASIEDLKHLYRDKEVLGIFYYFNSDIDPATCPASQLYDCSMWRDGERGYEVIWREHRDTGVPSSFTREC